MLKKFFRNPLYVQIGTNRMIFRNALSGQSLTLLPDAPFSHPRMLVGDFNRAEVLMKKGFKEVAGTGLLAVVPSVVVHPLDQLDGGLTQVEERVFRELALGSGARSFALWVGNPLSDQEVLNKLEQQ